MSKAETPRQDPISIGEIATPRFAKLSESEKLFVERAERFDALVPGDGLKHHLFFLMSLPPFSLLY